MSSVRSRNKTSSQNIERIILALGLLFRITTKALILFTFSKINYDFIWNWI